MLTTIELADAVGPDYGRDDIIRVRGEFMLIVECDGLTMTVAKPTWWRMARRWLRRLWRILRRRIGG